MEKRNPCCASAAFLFCAAFLLLARESASAQSAIVGVCLQNAPYYLTAAEQEDILGKMQAAGVKVIRAAITGDEQGYRFAQRVYGHGIKIVWMVCDCGPSGPMILSQADPEKFRAYFQSRLNRLESMGITLAGLEPGNEINWSNHDLGAPDSGTGRILGMDDLLNDPEGQQVAKGYLRYIRILAVLKDIRDHSKLNRHTPIISAGLSPWDPPSPAGSTGSKNDAVSLDATLRFLRAKGMDQYVDAYGIHYYPGGTWTPARRLSQLQQLLSQCRADKPCWITEWGLPASSGKSCPVVDDKRMAIFSELRNDYRTFVRQGRLSGLLLYDWQDAYMCGSLTKSGRLAISPL
jgi:hypothetical protein